MEPSTLRGQPQACLSFGSLQGAETLPAGRKTSLCCCSGLPEAPGCRHRFEALNEATHTQGAQLGARAWCGLGLPSCDLSLPCWQDGCWVELWPMCVPSAGQSQAPTTLWGLYQGCLKWEVGFAAAVGSLGAGDTGTCVCTCALVCACAAACISVHVCECVCAYLCTYAPIHT